MRRLRGFAGMLVAGALFVVLSGCAAMEREPSYVLRVTTGSEEAYVDEDGRTWLADQEYEEGLLWGAVGGNTVDRGDIAIAATTAPGVYRTERFGVEKYVFTVPPATYRVRLHFAETWDGIFGPGERVYDVWINDSEDGVVLKDFDPFEVSGGLDMPVVREFTGIRPVDGQITIGFEVNVQSPLINGIELIGF